MSVSALRRAVLILLLHTGAPALAQPSESWEPGVRHVVLSASHLGEVTQLRITPGLALTLFFDTAVRRMELEERERFRVDKLDEEGRMLTLVLAPGERPEKPLRLAVHFADEGVPASAEFRLVVHPAHAETHVEVYRQPRSAEACCQEAQTEKEKARQCEAALERTRTECHGKGGLIGLRAEGLMGEKALDGVRAQKLDSRKLTVHPTNALKMRDATGLSTTAPSQEVKEKRVRVAVWLQLENLGTRDWEAVGAQLAAPGGVRPETRVWQSTPIAPGWWEVMVEAELTEEEARGHFTLKLWDASGARTFSVGGVTFP